MGSKRTLRIALLQFFHGDAIGGHSKMAPIYKRISSVFYWNGLERDILHFICACEMCHCFKYKTVASPGLFQLPPVPEHIWIELSMDFISGLPKSQSKSTILVVVDRLGKAPLHCFATTLLSYRHHSGFHGVRR